MASASKSDFFISKAPGNPVNGRLRRLRGYTM
jgi:hypothetical protein